MNYSGKTVWITGASSGIGAELAKLFAQEGARVLISSHEAEELEGVRKALESVQFPDWVDHVEIDWGVGPEWEPAFDVEIFLKTPTLYEVVNDGKKIRKTNDLIYDALEEFLLDLWPYMSYRGVDEIDAA